MKAIYKHIKYFLSCCKTIYRSALPFMIIVIFLNVTGMPTSSKATTVILLIVGIVLMFERLISPGGHVNE